MNAETKNCQNCKKDFVIEPDDFSFYEKIKVPPPTFCPDCRAQRRFAWRNERSLYRNTCAATGKSVISCFPADSGIKVYNRDYWWSDTWDPLGFGMDYDFSKPFFVQFHELLKRVPLPAVFNARTVNCDYCNYVGDMKDAYLVSASWAGENLLYASREHTCKDSMDLYGVIESELCYECVSVTKSYRTSFSQGCENCADCMLCFECKGCTNCIGCTNLRNKSYCIFNEQFDREKYLEQVEKMKLDTRSGIEAARKDFEALRLKTVRKYATLTNATRCTGDNISNAGDCKRCFDLSQNVQNCSYIQNGLTMTDSYDGYGVGAHAELLYEAFDSGVQGSLQRFCGTVYATTDAHYCLNCHSCKDIFGCIGLRSREYCILNKQYTKEEYKSLVPKIIEQMNAMPYTDKKGRVYKYGEFFPMELSPFGYNATVAQDLFPLSKNEIEESGYNWRDPELKKFQPTVLGSALAERIVDTLDAITNEVVECVGCKEPYRIVSQELSLLRKMNLPIPKFCSECRHRARLALRNPLKLWHRSCMCDKEGHDHESKCKNEFETSYAPERPEIVYCESCYQKEVV